MYKRILLAYDGSVKGRAALREGALLARLVGAEVFLLSVIAEDSGTRLAEGAGGHGPASRPENYEAVLADGLARLKRFGFEAKAKLVVGDPAAEISSFARQVGADLVVVGHHRQSAFGRWWSGPSGAYLIEHIDCSMLVSQNVVSDAAFSEALSAGAGMSGVSGGGTAVANANTAGDRDLVEESATDVEPRPAEHSTRASPRRRRLRTILLLLLPVAAIVGLWWYVTGGQVMSTTDAYINADKVGISTDIAGIVSRVSVVENQSVARGQVLYTLDDLPFRLALQRAEAQVGIVRDEVNALKSNYRDAQAQLQQARNDVSFYETEFRRVRDLLASHVASQTAFDTARRNLQNAQHRVVSQQQQRAAIAANLDGDPEKTIEDNPRYRDATARRDEAARELAHTVVKAPFAGVVTNVSATATGRYLPVMGTAFYLVATDHVWVDANPKETELTYVHPGQPARVRVDSYPGRQWNGTVESISPAGAQEFSLLPAQNTSGNWVKVVQRIPMRVRLETGDRGPQALRAGMSVEVSVDTGHRRGWPHF